MQATTKMEGWWAVGHRLLAGGGESRRAQRASNDPEVTMSHALTHTKLIALDKALEAAGIAITLVMRVPAPLRSIADQVIRSASSVPATRRGPRADGERPAALVEDRLRFGQGGRQPFEAPPSGWSGQQHQGHEGDRDL
jgi:hypothetical protein